MADEVAANRANQDDLAAKASNWAWVMSADEEALRSCRTASI